VELFKFILETKLTTAKDLVTFFRTL